MNIEQIQEYPKVENEIELKQIKTFEGPSIHATFPVAEAEIDLGGYVETPSDKWFAERLVKALPKLKEHTCSKGYVGGFVERLEEGTYPAHIIEHITLALQDTVGLDVSFGKARRKEGSVYTVVVDYEYEPVVRLAVEEAIKIVNRLFDNDEDVSAYVREVIERTKKEYLKVKMGPSTEAIVGAARERKIPYKRISPEYSLYSLGWGKNRKMIWGPETSETSVIGSEISKEKDVSKDMLYTAGLPVPRGEVANSLEEALDIANYIGYPVVIKPVRGHHGNGVLVNLQDEEELKEAYEITSEYTNYVLVENYLSGEDYRALVIGNEVIAMAKRVPARVIGDGASTIKELVKLANQDPKRGDGHTSLLTKLSLGEEELMHLKQQGLNLDHIPDEGEIVYLRAVANLSTGGTAVDCSSMIHPTLKRTLERISKIIGLDVMGIDIIANDITLPVDEMNWGIIETNSSPGLRMHIAPTDGSPQPVGEKIVSKLFPAGNGRIPVIAITGTNGKTTTSRIAEWIGRNYGYHTGLAVTGGIWSKGEKITSGDTTGPWSANVILQDPEIELAVLETARGGILKRGIGFDRCQVGVVTNIRGDHLGLNGVEDLDDLFWTKSLVVEVTEKNGYSVINGNDNYAEKLMERARGTPVLFGVERNELIDEYIGEKGTAFVHEKGELVAYIDGEKQMISPVSDIPYLGNGAKMLIENTLAAVAACYSVGIPVQEMKKALATFELSEEMNPGRLNTYDLGEIKVVFDYAHNQDSLKALGEYIEGISSKGNKLVYTGLGDRSDQAIKENGEIAAKQFDNLIFTEKEDQLRGREPGMIAKLLRQGALCQGKEALIIKDAQEALSFALQDAKPGETVVCANLDFTSEDLQETLSKGKLTENSEEKSAKEMEPAGKNVVDNTAEPSSR